jgi:hypothetical protein
VLQPSNTHSLLMLAAEWNEITLIDIETIIKIITNE